MENDKRYCVLLGEKDKVRMSELKIGDKFKLFEPDHEDVFPDSFFLALDGPKEVNGVSGVECEQYSEQTGQLIQ